MSRVLRLCRQRWHNTEGRPAKNSDYWFVLDVILHAKDLCCGRQCRVTAVGNQRQVGPQQSGENEPDSNVTRETLSEACNPHSLPSQKESRSASLLVRRASVRRRHCMHGSYQVFQRGRRSRAMVVQAFDHLANERLNFSNSTRN
jgi:hypothetical protein